MRANRIELYNQVTEMRLVELYKNVTVANQLLFEKRAKKILENCKN